MTATVVDTDGVTQATLRGDGASMTTLGAGRDKAYTVLMLGEQRNEDTSGAIEQRIGATPSAGGLAKLPHILLLPSAIRIKVDAEAIGASAARPAAISMRPAQRPTSIRLADG